MRSAIEIEDVTKVFRAGRQDGPAEALKQVNLTIFDNEFLTILGPSGCGKTTLLRQIAGLSHPDSGHISAHGQRVTSPSPDRAMVFQQFALLPWATVLKNVTIGLEIRGDPKAQREARGRELIELVGLKGFEEHLPGQLSGGMQQRVGLARALAVDPSVALMDEPFGALDEQTRRLLQEELLRIWEEQPLTVVFVTHSIQEAVLLADRVVVMTARPGRIAEVIDIDIPRPRSRHLEEIERSAEFVGLCNDLWDRLRGMQVQPGLSTR